MRWTATLSVALGEVADVVLVEVLVEGGPQQLLGEVCQDGRRPGDETGRQMEERECDRERRTRRQKRWGERKETETVLTDLKF